MRIQNLKILRALTPQETLLSSLLCDLYSNDWRRYDIVMCPLGGVGGELVLYLS